MSHDYKATLFLPETDFPMKGSLPVREPEMLARWEDMNLYGRLRADAKGRKKFILHDGPPYANGNIHIGHALNKILKDVIVRAAQMRGHDAPYVPGWDCHGLPIEWQIEEKYRKAGKNKDEVPVAEFRQECRDFAAAWIDVQREEFKRLGVLGDWDHPYTTMAFDAEATIVGELNKFAMNGSLYRGAKPVMWSPVEKTALAEAEIEYEDITSTQIDVAFKITSCPKRPELEGAYAVIWTTTPWTLPVNRALAYGPEVEYQLCVIGASEANGTPARDGAKIGAKILVATGLRRQVEGRLDCILTPVETFQGSDLEGALCQHPWTGKSEFFDEPRPMLPGDFVTTDAGTGIVHMAPDHGEDDFYLCKAHGIDPVFVVQPDGSYKADWPVVAGLNVLNGKLPALIGDELGDACLAISADFKHSYPHSWRSKKKVIYRCTPQWFISMNKTSLRAKALKAIAETRFVPEQGRNRIQSMVEGRPDWVISRQRAWGVPITVFVHKETAEILRDEAVNARIVAAVKAAGADAWFAADPQSFLGDNYKSDDYEQVTDILDVWFDSGSTHAFVLESGTWPALAWPADLYLEGSDQHRGWFQSSLLESCGTRGRAPYNAVLTHGFVLDGARRKMSKSLGNVVAPQKIVDQYGADILRLWVCSTDYSDDVPIGDDIIKSQTEAYRKMRNTLRYLLSNLAGFDPAERLAVEDMPELERWVLHRLHCMDELITKASDAYNFTRIYNAIYNFCNVDLSIFYFDIRKDTLYCDAHSSIRRRAARTVLDELFNCLVRWLAPILVFTTEEAWQARFPDPENSIHLQQFPAIPANWRNDELAAKWEKIRSLRRVVTGALEIDRREKRIGASLQAVATVYVQDQSFIDAFEGVNPAEVSITSAAHLVLGDAPEGAYRLEDVPNVAVVTGLAEGVRCERCWQVLPEVGQVPAYDDLCHRCADAVQEAG